MNHVSYLLSFLLVPLRSSLQSQRSTEDSRSSSAAMAPFVRDKWLLTPDHKAKTGWDIFLAIMVIYTAIMVPYRIGFNDPPDGAMEGWEMFVNVIFMADILVTFRTAYRNRNGELITDGWQIAKNYATGSLLMDILSSLPYDQMAANNAHLLQSARLLRILRLARLLRLFRLTQLKKILGESEETFLLSNNNVTMLKVFFTLAAIAHLIGCFWHWDVYLSRPGETTWRSAIESLLGRNLSQLMAYIDSIYFAFTTMTTVGYGDILPTKNSERVWTILFQLVGGLTFGFIVGNVTSLIQNLDPAATMYKEKIEMIKAYLKDRNFPKDQYTRITNYFEYYFEGSTLFDNSKVSTAGLRQLSV